MRKKFILSGVCIIITIGIAATRIGSFSARQDASVADIEKKPYEYHYSDSQGGEKIVKQENTSTPTVEKQYIEVDTDPESYTVLVNREHLLPEDYVPSDLVVPNISFSYRGIYEKSYMRKRAAAALEELFSAALKKNYRLYGVSAYRSYKRQDQIYRNNVQNKGEEQTNQVSAMPGSSEHQTGLAIDVSCDAVDCALEESFGRTPEGTWLKKNCHKYGFIIRYPHWRERVTGYTYEPWHIRYVGKNLAKYIYQKKLTLEEYYQQTTVENKVESDPISDIDDISATDEPEMTTAPTPAPTPVPTATERASAEPKSTPSGESTEPPQTKTPPTKAPQTKEPKESSTPDVETKEPETEPVETKKPLETSPPETEGTPDSAASQEETEENEPSEEEN